MTVIRSNKSFRDSEKHKKMQTEDMKGEESISGSMPDPEADDDVTDFEKEAGLYLNENEDKPEEADLSGEIEEADEEVWQN